MKTTEFLNENSVIAQEADNMHKDHEVQMARSQMYSAAQSAIEIHKLLKNISELEGLDGWVSSKLTLASEYLETVRDYLKYEAASEESEMMQFTESAANYAFESIVAEARKGDTNFGHTVTQGSWVVYDGSKVKRFKSRANAKAYAEKNGGKVASSEFYADNVQKQGVTEEGWKDWSEKNPGKLNTQTADMYDRNTHRWSGDTGMPGAKEHGGKDELKTVDRRGNPVTNLATRVEKPEGVPRVAKKPITSFGGGGGGMSGHLSDPSAVKSLIPNFESKLGEMGETGEERAAAASRENERYDNASNYQGRNARGDVIRSGGEVVKGNPNPPSLLQKAAGKLGFPNTATDALGDPMYKSSKPKAGSSGRGGGGGGSAGVMQDPEGMKSRFIHFEGEHDRYDEDLSEEAKKGLYYNVNKRKAAGTSRDKDDPKAPTAQAWRDAAKTAKKESVEESAGGMGAASVAISMSGPAHKPTTGVPKRLGNSHKPKKVTVGKGIY